MPVNLIRIAPAKGPGVCVDKGFIAKPETYDLIYAYARKMNWMEKPFHFVVSRWLDCRNVVPACRGRRAGANRAKRRGAD